jgi:cell division protein FtsI/penicillin-binding protein 2
LFWIPANGDLLAAASYPVPAQMPPVLSPPEADDAMFDRARYGLYPPGSSFKIVTAIAALRKDPAAINQQYDCVRLPDGRVGNTVKGWSRPIRDDIMDKTPHGAVDMRKGIVVSCNAYFAQLGTYKVQADALLETANLLGISVAILRRRRSCATRSRRHPTDRDRWLRRRSRWRARPRRLRQAGPLRTDAG